MTYVLLRALRYRIVYCVIKLREMLLGAVKKKKKKPTKVYWKKWYHRCRVKLCNTKAYTKHVDDIEKYKEL